MPDPKLQRIPSSKMTEELRAAHDHSMQLRGDTTFFEVFANHPDLYGWYTKSFYGNVFRGGLVDQRMSVLLSAKGGRMFLNFLRGAFSQDSGHAQSIACPLFHHPMQ